MLVPQAKAFESVFERILDTYYEKIDRRFMFYRLRKMAGISIEVMPLHFDFQNPFSEESQITTTPISKGLELLESAKLFEAFSVGM